MSQTSRLGWQLTKWPCTEGAMGGGSCLLLLNGKNVGLLTFLNFRLLTLDG